MNVISLNLQLFFLVFSIYIGETYFSLYIGILRHIKEDWYFGIQITSFGVGACFGTLKWFWWDEKARKDMEDKLKNHFDDYSNGDWDDKV